jgi:hypothetical protein
MGAVAEAFAAFAQPLLDQTDGSEGQLNKAFAISELCYKQGLLRQEAPLVLVRGIDAVGVSL